MIVSKLTAKARTTIPRIVRAALNLRAGDVLVYEIKNHRVILTKVGPDRKGFSPYRVFDEWNSEADARAYCNL